MLTDDSDSDIARFVQGILKQITVDRAETVAAVCDGMPKSYEHYREMVGMIAAFDTAKSIVIEELANLGQDDDVVS